MYWIISRLIYRLNPGYCTGLFPGQYNGFIQPIVLAYFQVNILAFSRLISRSNTGFNKATVVAYFQINIYGLCTG